MLANPAPRPDDDTVVAIRTPFGPGEVTRSVAASMNARISDQPMASARLLVHCRHPAIAVGVQDIGFAQAVRLVGRFRQHMMAMLLGALDRDVGVAVIQPDLY